METKPHSLKSSSSDDTERKDSADTVVAGQASAVPTSAHTHDNSVCRQLTTEELYANAKPKRTLGQKFTDIGLYAVLMNTLVFVGSVAATFLTARGGDLHNGVPIYGKTGQWFQKRGVWLENKFQGMGMSQKDAEMAKVVAFSYIDGTLMSIPVKLLEDHRSGIAHRIDSMLGTKPEKLATYDAEPQQSWLSVLGGRTAAAAVVIPTAMLLSRKVAYRAVRNPLDPASKTQPFATVFGDSTREANTSLNDIAFNDLSEQHANKLPRFKVKFGEWLERRTGVGAHETVMTPTVNNGSVTYAKVNQGDATYKTLARMSYFELFYTSVCTAGLYLGSRALAPFINKRHDEKIAHAEAAKHQNELAHTSQPVEDAKAQSAQTSQGPSPRVHTQALEKSQLAAASSALGASAPLQGI